MMEYDESGIRIRPLTLEEQAAAARDELELSIRRKQKEMKDLQKRINSDSRHLAMVAEPGNTYSGEVVS